MADINEMNGVNGAFGGVQFGSIGVNPTINNQNGFNNNQNVYNGFGSNQNNYNVINSNQNGYNGNVVNNGNTSNNTNYNQNASNIYGNNFGTGINQNYATPVNTRNKNLPVKAGFWTKFKNFWLQDIPWNYEIKVELTPYQQKVEDEINEFLHQEITWEKVHDFLFQEVSFGSKR